MYFRVINNDGEIILDTFPNHLNYLFKQMPENTNPIKIDINGELTIARFGQRSNQLGTILALTTKDKYVKRLKSFKEFLDSNLVILETIPKIKADIYERQNSQTTQLIHNLTSLNSYSIQELFSLIPQHLLTKNLNTQGEIVKKIIRDKPNITSDTLLRLIKYNLSMKIEFSVFDKTLEERPIIRKTQHKIREIIKSILHIFVYEFEEKKITLSLSSTDSILFVDYDSLSVSLYYIIENALKYCLNNTSLKIQFLEEHNNFYIIFKMESLRIEEEEKDKICDFKYRSSNAIKLNKSGQGIGMYRVLKTLSINNASLEIIPRYKRGDKNTSDGTFEHNMFKIKFIDYQSLV